MWEIALRDVNERFRSPTTRFERIGRENVDKVDTTLADENSIHLST
jgi:hypothetical protein